MLAFQRFAHARLFAVALLFLLAAEVAGAQLATPAVGPVPNVGIDQKLGAQIPLDLPFVDQDGRQVTLRDYMTGTRPVIITPVYYGCPMLCTEILNGVAETLKQLRLTPGKDYEVLTFSFDPEDTSELAATKRANYLKELGRPEMEQGWHFLVGPESSSAALTQALGFRYQYDEKTGEYAHASGIMILTPSGVVSRYFFGIEYPEKDVRLSLVEASGGKVGRLVDQLMLLCYHFDPTTGAYTVTIMRVLRVAGIAAVAAIAAIICGLLLVERRASRRRGAAENPA